MRAYKAYKIYVYAICKDESTFARRWMASMAEADGVYVLDTGSSDGTPALLEGLGAHVVTQTVEPWRFDTARNRSLELVPEDADLCVCTDLDEVFHSGWREKMERALDRGARRVRYRYTWSFRPDGGEGVVFWLDKAHTRHGWRWASPVHETLKWTGDGPEPQSVDAEGVQLDHHADDTKSRGQYLPLLELAVEEDPQNDRNMHYLGREYMFRGMWRQCEQTLLRHLALPGATWRDERCASMRFLARAALGQGRPQDAEGWLLRAAAEAPWLREPWLEAAQLALDREEWSGALFFAEKALAIRWRSQSYINEADSWGPRPWDLAALAAYYAGCREKALEYGKNAAALAPEDERLRQNLAFYEAKATPRPAQKTAPDTGREAVVSGAAED